jgi:hypothetical protein
MSDLVNAMEQILLREGVMDRGNWSRAIANLLAAEAHELLANGCAECAAEKKASA